MSEDWESIKKTKTSLWQIQNEYKSLQAKHKKLMENYLKALPKKRKRGK